MKNSGFFLLAFVLSTACVAQVPAHVPTGSLKGWYSFSGNASDLSGNNNNGTVSGAQLTSNSNNIANSAYLFTPTNQIVTPYVPNPLSSYAIFADFNASSLTSNLSPISSQGLGNCLVSSDQTGSGGFAIGVAVGQFAALCGQTWITIPYNFSTSSWYKVGANFDMNNQYVEFFVNGASIGTVAVAPFPSNSPQAFHIGFIGPMCYVYPFDGKIDEVGIWDRVLSYCEIEQLYNTALLSPNPQPQAQVVNAGMNALFVTGTQYPNTSFQWQIQNGIYSNISNGGQYSGATTFMLNISPVLPTNNNKLYRCVLSAGNCTVVSSPALLKVQTEGTGITSNDRLLGACITPNPTNGVFSIAPPADHLTIFDPSGRLVYSVKDAMENHVVDLRHLTGGVYSVCVIRGNRMITGKLIKED
jgi:hypothetical protein